MTMRPIDFVFYDGDSAPNTPAHLIFDALTKPLKISDGYAEFVVFGYYYDGEDKCMVLEIKKIREE